MAGRRHHHIPQFLQRKFGLQGTKATKVVVFRKGAEPFSTNTINYGAERDFYSEGDNFFVDDLITDYESDIQAFLNLLTVGNENALQERETIAALISHLEMRSAFLRSQLLELSEAIVSFIEKTFTDRTLLKKMLITSIKDNPAILRDAIVESLGKDVPVSALEEFVTPQLEALIGSSISPFVEGFADTLVMMHKSFHGIVKPAHIKALSSHPDEMARRKFYSDLTYSIRNEPSGSFILPDTMVSFATKNRLTPITQKGDELVEVFLPLSSGSLLVGSRKKMQPRKISEFNSLLASTSYKSFIAIEDRPEFRMLSTKIGRNAKLMSEADTKSAFREVLKELTGNKRA